MRSNIKTSWAVLWLCSLAQTASLAGVAVVGSLARSHNVQPGQSFEGIILVKNTGRESVEVRLSQTDYQFFADGRTRYDPPGSHPRSNADWLTVRPVRFSLGADETVSVSYKGVVPEKPDLAGTYWSIVMVEPLARSANNPTGLVVQTQVRFGVQLVTEVGDAPRGPIRVLDKKLIQKKLQLDLENSGVRLLIPSVWVELFNRQGQSVGKFEAGRSRIFPGCSVRYQVDLTDVPAGRYSALVIVDNGDENVMGAQYELELSP